MYPKNDADTTETLSLYSNTARPHLGAPPTSSLKVALLLLFITSKQPHHTHTHTLPISSITHTHTQTSPQLHHTHTSPQLHHTHTHTSPQLHHTHTHTLPPRSLTHPHTPPHTTTHQH